MGSRNATRRLKPRFDVAVRSFVTLAASLAPLVFDDADAPPEVVVVPTQRPLHLACLLGALLAMVAGGARVGETPTYAAGKAPPRATPMGMTEHWVKAPVITFDPSLADLGHGAPDAVRAAFGTWLGAGAPGVTFANATTRGALGLDGVSRVLAGRIPIPGHEHDVAVTVSYADDATGNIVEADTIFNTQYAFGAVDADAAKGTCKTYDTQSVATHEAGHFFGLSEDADDTTTTMYQLTRPCDPHKRELYAPDRDAIGSLYSASTTGGSKAQACSVSGTPGAPGSGGATFVVAAALVLAARRRRRAGASIVGGPACG